MLDAARDAKLIYGLRQDCTKKEMQKALAEGTVMKYLQKVPIHNEELTDFTNNCSQKLIQSSSLAALEFKSIVLSM
ncbi:hypothetical protein [Blautia obeum]|uniref:hypothetical protein n=1 Tax=Blautia obeum TaxID=40520 RepID=UPI0006D85367|nr:hypothetical protein [Blautia obeum]